MFKGPFSFEGRIRRMEYGITFIIYVICYGIALTLFESPDLTMLLLGWVILIPTLWFILAQSAKRCHDVGRSGWFQIIPFYFLILLFHNSDAGRNEYGQNPKEAETIDALESETLDGHMRN